MIVLCDRQLRILLILFYRDHLIASYSKKFFMIWQMCALRILYMYIYYAYLYVYSVDVTFSNDRFTSSYL